jgi:hypothetical protein
MPDRPYRIPTLLILAAACQSPGTVADLDPDGFTSSQGHLRDGLGREILLRGVNARVEGLFDVTFDDGRTPLEPIPPFTGEDCRFLAEELGLHHLRLPVNWSAIEPDRGTYRDDYFEAITELVDDCADVGVWTIVDIHQDAYSKHIGEDGAPLWAILPEPETLLEGPLDDLGERRISSQVLAAFTSFYANEDGIRDAYVDMSRALAQSLVGHPGAVALEVHNEPVSLGRQDLLDILHRDVAAAAREVHPALSIAFEPDAQRNFTDRITVPEPLGVTNSIYAPHVYTQVFTTGWISEDEAALQASVAAARTEAAFHDAALYVGEFGNDPDSDHGMHYIETSLASFDTHLASWAFWVYEEWSQDAWGLYLAPEDAPEEATLREHLADVLARPYPIAIDGTLASLDWNADTRTLTIELRDAGAHGHVISAPARTWPSDVQAACDGLRVDVERVAGRLLVTCDGSTLSLAP